MGNATKVTPRRLAIGLPPAPLAFGPVGGVSLGLVCEFDRGGASCGRGGRGFGRLLRLATLFVTRCQRPRPFLLLVQ